VNTCRRAYGENVKNDKKISEGQDDIQSILRHSGVISPYLDRMRQISSQMNQLEWKLVKRAAAANSRNPLRFPSAD
jgi:hypothetical protein